MIVRCPPRSFIIKFACEIAALKHYPFGETTSAIPQAGVRPATSSAITQGIGVATGMQAEFSWAGVAAAGVGAEVGAYIGGKIDGQFGPGAQNTKLGQLGVNSARAIANAATRSAIEGSQFGDNLRAAIPDVIGQAIGGVVGGAFSGSAQSSELAAKAAEDPTQVSSAAAIARVNGDQIYTGQAGGYDRYYSDGIDEVVSVGVRASSYEGLVQGIINARSYTTNRRIENNIAPDLRGALTTYSDWSNNRTERARMQAFLASDRLRVSGYLSNDLKAHMYRGTLSIGEEELYRQDNWQSLPPDKQRELHYMHHEAFFGLVKYFASGNGYHSGYSDGTMIAFRDGLWQEVQSVRYTEYDTQMRGTLGTATAEVLGEVAGMKLLIKAGRSPSQPSRVSRRTSKAENVWDLPPVRRGQRLEEIYGQNLHQNYPTIDRFSQGIATSIKSIDLSAKTYQDMSKLTRKLRGYVDKVAGFRGADFGGHDIRDFQISVRRLDLIVPRQISSDQMSVLTDLNRHASETDVLLNIIKH